MNTKHEKPSLFYGVSMFNPSPDPKNDNDPPTWFEVAFSVAKLIGQAGITLFVYFSIVFALIELLT